MRLETQNAATASLGIVSNKPSKAISVQPLILGNQRNTNPLQKLPSRNNINPIPNPHSTITRRIRPHRHFRTIIQQQPRNPTRPTMKTHRRTNIIRPHHNRNQSPAPPPQPQPAAPQEQPPSSEHQTKQPPPPPPTTRASRSSQQPKTVPTQTPPRTGRTPTSTYRNRSPAVPGCQRWRENRGARRHLPTAMAHYSPFHRLSAPSYCDVLQLHLAVAVGAVFVWLGFGDADQVRISTGPHTCQPE